MPQRTRMSAADTAWFRMEEPTNLMMITGLLQFDETPDRERLARVITERLVTRYPRFRRRIVPSSVPLASPFWEDAADFDLDHHLVRVRLDPPGDRAALERLVAKLMSSPLERGRPPWQLHLIDGLGSGGAVLARLHHCIADGIALSQVLLSLTDEESGADVQAMDDELLDAPPQAEGGSLSRRVLAGIQLGARGMGTLGRLLVMPRDRPSILRGSLSVAKHAAWSDPFPLDEVKAVGRAAGATVNDVLLSAVTGALHRYLEKRSDPAEEVRAFIPINLRPRGVPVPDELGNRFGIVFLPLPVGLEAPRERLDELKRRMDELKDSAQPAVTWAILNSVGRAPFLVQRLVTDLLGAKASAVMTNVPGPAQTVYLAGSPVTGIMFWVPQSGHVGLGVSILSYAGQVTLGVGADENIVPDPEVIVRAFEAELGALVAELDVQGVS
jgi:WS/DGAT/MGAT family acyltransferase